MKSFQKLLRKLLALISLALFSLLFQGCDSTESTDSNVSLSFSKPILTQKIVEDTVILDTVKILLRDVKLQYELDSEEDIGEDDDGEISVKVGPFVVYLNLNGVTTDFAVGNIPVGNYNKVKFKIHQIEASENPPDPEFKKGDNSSLRYSVIVKGHYNSQPFVYKSRKPAHQKIEFEQPLVIEPNTITNLTITVDPSSWFVKDNLILDPTDPANENDIDNNIKDSFKRCFKDDDHNGDDD